MRNYTDGNTKTCGIIGNPVHHTLSPVIHNRLAEMTGLNLVYVPFEVESGALKDAVQGANALKLHGLNVTVPYKSDIIPYLKEVDSLAADIGAVNTLVPLADGSGFKGYNTDMTGLYHAMQDEGIDISGKTVVILGAGGVARPAAYLCADKGASRIYILNRTFEKAEAVAGEVNHVFAGKKVNIGEADDAGTVIPKRLDEYNSLFEKIPADSKVIAIQCTSVGLSPDTDSAVIEDERFYKHIDVAIDVVYTPLETRFIKLARAAGAKTLSGLKMLLYQAIDAFELWNAGADIRISKEQADDIYRTLMLEVLGCRNIILEGFMGSGKSTVSERLADRLGLELVDTDAMIEETEHRTITDIFDQNGEETFRDMETDLLDFFVQDHFDETVFSLGGGLPVREQNRELLKKLGKVVYLRTKPETVYERIKGDTTRPLISGSDNPLEKIRLLHDGRRDIYEAAADIIIDTDELNPDEIAGEIISRLGLAL